MKLYAFLLLIVGSWMGIAAQTNNLICYYNADSAQREAQSQYNITDLEIALQFCTHLIYGFVGIKSDTFEVVSLQSNPAWGNAHAGTIAALKRKFPHVKFILSLGGDRDADQAAKHIALLEAGKSKQLNFIVSAHKMVHDLGFDGLDLALQFPRNKPRKVHTGAGTAWKGFKKFFTGDFVVDKDATWHKEQYTGLVHTLTNVFHAAQLTVSMTVLPNVNSTWYFDVPVLSNKFDFVTLAAFDFLTPGRNPDEADYTAPLYVLNDQNRLGHYNVNFQVDFWLSKGFPSNRLNLGIASYGRAWELTSDSGTSGTPVVPTTNGAAPAGALSKKNGLLNWPEICGLLATPTSNVHHVHDITKSYGSYAFRPANENGKNGIWISYEDPETAADKAIYAKSKGLGGIALFDLSHDDFQGTCSGHKYPILRATKYRLL